MNTEYNALLEKLDAKYEKNTDLWILRRILLDVDLKTLGGSSDEPKWKLISEIIHALEELDSNFYGEYSHPKEKLKLRFKDKTYTFKGEILDCYTQAALSLL